MRLPLIKESCKLHERPPTAQRNYRQHKPPPLAFAVVCSGGDENFIPQYAYHIEA